MKRIKTILLACFIIVSCLGHKAMAQTTFSIGTDLESRYVWRGLLCGGAAPSIQPSMTFSYKGLEVAAWGAYSTAENDLQEFDLTISYTFLDDMFTVLVSDYCFPTPDDDFCYFDYGKNTTSHVFEAGLLFNGVENVPVSLEFYLNLYGADATKPSGDTQFSSYAEVSYNPSIEQWGLDLSVFAGAALNGKNYIVDGDVEPYVFESYYGNDGFAFTNVGLKASKNLTPNAKFEMPLGAKMIFNPNANKAYFVASLGIHI